MIFLSFISIVGWIIFLTLKYRRFSSFFPVFVLTGIISLLYISGFVHLLFWVSKIIFALGFFLPVYYFFTTRHTTKLSLVNQLTSLPISSYFIIITGIIWFGFTRHATLFGWDEFFWSQFTKVLTTTHAFYNAQSPILDYKLNYPPGPGLFQYFFMQFNNFSESGVYFSQGILALAGIAPLFDFSQKNWKRFLVLLISIAAALVYFGPGLLLAMNDHTLGILFAAGFIGASYTLISFRSKLLILPVLFALPLIKETGIALSGTIIITILIDLFFVQKDNLKNIWKDTTTRAIFIGVIVLLLATPIIATKSWDMYLKSQHIPTNTSLIRPKTIINSFSSKQTKKDKTIIENFKAVIYNLPINSQIDPKLFTNPYLQGIFLIKIQKIGLTIFEWSFLSFFVLGLVIKQSNKEDSDRNINIAISTLIGLGLYLFLHLILYLTIFSKFEALQLASVDRYISSYALGLSLILIAILSQFFSADKNPRKPTLKPLLYFLAAYLFLFHTPPLYKYVVSPQRWAQTTNVVRNKTKPYSQEIVAKTPKNSRIWTIYEGSNGWESMMIRFDIMPRRMNSWDWWIKTSPPQAQEIWASQIAPDVWAKTLLDNNYNYVYLAHVDDSFWKDYSSIFINLDTSKHLYKVVNTDNKVTLQPVTK